MPTQGDKARILLVDDEHDIIEVFRQGLTLHGYHVDAYTDPERALAEANPEQYERIFLDIRMPKINGFDLARAMWKKERDAKVCFLSSFEIYEDEANKVFKDFITRCFIKKPVSIKALIEHIEGHVQVAG